MNLIGLFVTQYPDYDKVGCNYLDPRPRPTLSSSAQVLLAVVEYMPSNIDSDLLVAFLRREFPRCPNFDQIGAYVRHCQSANEKQAVTGTSPRPLLADQGSIFSWANVLACTRLRVVLTH